MRQYARGGTCSAMDSNHVYRALCDLVFPAERPERPPNSWPQRLPLLLLRRSTHPAWRIAVPDGRLHLSAAALLRHGPARVLRLLHCPLDLVPVLTRMFSHGGVSTVAAHGTRLAGGFGGRAGMVHRVGGAGRIPDGSTRCATHSADCRGVHWLGLGSGRGCRRGISGKANTRRSRTSRPDRAELARFRSISRQRRISDGGSVGDYLVFGWSPETSGY